jgi:hypothetical protein
MVRIFLELIIGPLLVGVSTLVGRRWGARVGGAVSAFPAVVGPVLLITATERGPAFAARAASGTLLGLVALSGFVVTYARTAVRSPPAISLLTGWVCAAVTAGVVGWVGHGAGLPAGLAAACGSLLVAHRAMPRSEVHVVTGAGGVRARMAATALLVAGLASVAVLVGPLVGGILTALPVLASVLAVFAHRSDGVDAVVALLRGMLLGMIGFVGFCVVVAWLIVAAGTTWAFAAAAVTAVGLQLIVLQLNSASTDAVI